VPAEVGQGAVGGGAAGGIRGMERKTGERDAGSYQGSEGPNAAEGADESFGGSGSGDA